MYSRYQDGRIDESISGKLLGYLQGAWAAAGYGVKRSPADTVAIAEQVSKTFSHHFDAIISD